MLVRRAALLVRRYSLTLGLRVSAMLMMVDRLKVMVSSGNVPRCR